MRTFGAVRDTPRVATTWYVDSIAGDDNNSGLAAAYPKKTISPTGYNVIAGDTILLKYGSEWRGSLAINRSGTAENKITYGAYGTPADGRPIINTTALITDWTNVSGNIWRAPITLTGIRRVFIDRVAVGLAASAAAVDESKKWFADESYLYIYATSDPDTAYTSPGVEVPNGTAGISLSGQQYITLQNLHLMGSAAYQVDISAAADVLIEDCTLDLPGSFGVYSITNAPRNITIKGCTIDNARATAENTGSKGVGRDGVCHYSGGENILIQNLY